MKKENLYESPVAVLMEMLMESAILSSSTTVEGMGMKDLTYEDIQWN